jgi:hypothetical protein
VTRLLLFRVAAARYSLVLSDSAHLKWGLLGNPLNDLITDDTLRRGNVVRILDSVSCSSFPVLPPPRAPSSPCSSDAGANYRSQCVTGLCLAGALFPLVAIASTTSAKLRSRLQLPHS